MMSCYLVVWLCYYCCFFFSSRRRHTRCALVTGVQTCALPICRPQDFQWFYQEGASRLSPDYWEDYLAPIPADERGDLMQAFYRSEERRVGKECVSTCRSRWSPYH